MAIIVGFVANEEGRAALAAAVQEGQRRQESLVVLVHALRGEQSTITTGVNEAKELTADAGVAVEIRPNPSEDLAEGILSLVAETSPSLIVIGLRRRSVTGKLILGSNAQRILLDSPTPVLAIKSNS